MDGSEVSLVLRATCDGRKKWLAKQQDQREEVCHWAMNSSKSNTRLHLVSKFLDLIARILLGVKGGYQGSGFYFKVKGGV